MTLSSLKGECDHCGGEGTAYHTFMDGSKAYLCPTHRRAMAIAEAATADLKLHVKEALMTWLEQYGDLPYVTRGLADALRCISDEVADDAQRSHDAQPAPIENAAD